MNMTNIYLLQQYSISQ